MLVLQKFGIAQRSNSFVQTREPRPHIVGFIVENSLPGLHLNQIIFAVLVAKLGFHQVFTKLFPEFVVLVVQFLQILQLLLLLLHFLF